MNRLTSELQKAPQKDVLFQEIARVKGYPIFKYNNVFQHNINIWGIRSKDTETRTYNDTVVWFFQKQDGQWDFRVMPATTDPSEHYLINPMNPNGTFILKEGHYKSLWCLGMHAWKYKALVQYTPVPGYRDNNKDGILDLTNEYEAGLYGINHHHGADWGNSDDIGLHSAGCQVIQDTQGDWNPYVIPMMETFEREGQRTFSYTLINEQDIINIRR